MPDYEIVDDPEAACPLCVTWVDPEPDDTGYVDQGLAHPTDPWGNPVRRLYRQPHDECQLSVNEMLDGGPK